MAVPLANQRVTKVFSEAPATYLHLVKSWPLLHTSVNPFNGRSTYFFAAAAAADLDEWARTIDRFRAEAARAQQVAAR